MRRLISALALATLAGALLVGPATTANAGGGPHCEPTLTDMKTDVVRMKMNCFMPTIARVEPGAKVRFINEDGIPHTVTGAVYVFGDMSEFSKGERSFSFKDEGTYPYVCILHPGMAGAIVVGDGKGDASAMMSVTEETYANPPAEDASAAADTQAPATEPASSREPSTQWLLALTVLMGLAMAGALRLPRRKAQQLEG